MRLWKEKTSQKVVAVNTSFRIAPFADYVFAMDLKWWERYRDEVPAEKRISSGKIPNVRKVPCMNPGNSGAGAIGLAHFWGAKRIILLGYDCKKIDGMVHHHGDHPKGLGNAGSMPLWPTQFAQLANRMKRCKIDIINCSPDSALNFWPRMSLEEALNVTDT